MAIVLGFDGSIGSRSEILDGIYTGQPGGPFAYGDGKAASDRRARRRGGDLARRVLRVFGLGLRSPDAPRRRPSGGRQSRRRARPARRARGLAGAPLRPSRPSDPASRRPRRGGGRRACGWPGARPTCDRQGSRVAATGAGLHSLVMASDVKAPAARPTAPATTLSGTPIRPLYTEADLPDRRIRPSRRSACQASTRTRAGSTRRCTAAGSGRCASSPASARPRRPTSASATCSTRARPASARRSTCRA